MMCRPSDQGFSGRELEINYSGAIGVIKVKSKRIQLTNSRIWRSYCAAEPPTIPPETDFS